MYDREQYILSEIPLKNDLLKLFNVHDKMVILDIGGCEGEESIRYSKLFPNARISVFEPLPQNQLLITAHLKKYAVSNVTLEPYALSDKQSIEDFYVSSGRPDGMDENMNWDFGNKSSSLLPPDKLDKVLPWLKFKDVIQIPTNTLKNFFTHNSISAIDFIHMDVQGAELKVLNGAKSAIEKIKAIWLEVSNDDLYKDQPKKNDIEIFMIKHDFVLVKSVFEGITGDQLYLNKRYFKALSFFGRKKYIKLRRK